MKIYGFPIDGAGRCKHYHGENDIISIKFKCCNKYYPCYKCHQECENHPIQSWNKSEFEKRAILCGICKKELTITEYLSDGKCTVVHFSIQIVQCIIIFILVLKMRVLQSKILDQTLCSRIKTSV